MKLAIFCCSIIAIAALSGHFCLCADDANNNMGFLCRPPVYIISYPDFPLTGMGIELPAKGVIVPDGDVSSTESDGFRKNGVNVQPALRVEKNTYRLGALRGFGGGWAAGITIPWCRNPVRGNIGGLPAYGVGEGFGDMGVVGKKLLWENCSGMKVVGSVGLELPTGKDDATFGQNDAATRGYYTGPTPRMPLGWQAGSGSLDAYLAIAAGRRQGRISYMGLVAAKLHTEADQDVKIGNIFAASLSGTYGVSKNIAAALELDLRTQANDSYPNSPLPVEGPLLAGTTTHGTMLFITPSVRVRIANRFTIGVGVKYPIVKPDNGMVPRVDFSFILSPGL